MNQSLPIRFLVLLFALALTACSGSPTSESDERYLFPDLEEVDHISTFHVRHWQAIDDRSLIVGSTKRNQYLLILDSRMPDLKFAFTLGITSTGSTIHALFDCVKTENMPCSTSQHQARIRRMYKLADQQQADWAKAQILNTSKIP